MQTDKDILAPKADEPICLISYEVTHILLGDGPQNRPSFWKNYRRELDLNQQTDYQNYHVNLCRPHLTSLRLDRKEPVYYRNGRLVTEKDANPLLGGLLKG